MLHCKNARAISTCLCLSELLTLIDDCISDKHKQVETIGTNVGTSQVDTCKVQVTV